MTQFNLVFTTGQQSFLVKLQFALGTGVPQTEQHCMHNI